MCSLKVSCFDVDYAANPKSKNACPLDHVSVTCVGQLQVLKRCQAAFLLSLCSFGQPLETLTLARINYSGPDKGRDDFRARIKTCAGAIELNRDSNGCQIDAFLTEDRACATALLSEYWRSYGGNWIIAVNCSVLDVFRKNCSLAESGILRASEVRDRLVAVSDTAAVTFDDDIADIITVRYNAETMRKKLISLAEQFELSIEYCEK